MLLLAGALIADPKIISSILVAFVLFTQRSGKVPDEAKTRRGFRVLYDKIVPSGQLCSGDPSNLNWAVSSNTILTQGGSPAESQLLLQAAMPSAQG